MRWLGRFAGFWYDFIVGDDWTIAVVAVASVGLAAVVAHHGWSAWPVLPACVFAALAGSLWRARRAHERAEGPATAPDERTTA